MDRSPSGLVWDRAACCRGGKKLYTVNKLVNAMEKSSDSNLNVKSIPIIKFKTENEGIP